MAVFSKLKRGGGSLSVGLSLLAVLVLVLALFVASCGADEGEDTETTEAEGTETTAVGGEEGAVQRGGTIRVGSQPATNLDPHFSTSIADIMMNHQIYDWLVEIDQENQPAPGLAESWESNEDGTVWTFHLVEGVTFHDGSEFNADDVVYTFDRLRDPDVGTPVVTLYESIEEIVAVDPLTVEFRLTRPNPEFPADVGDYHSAVLSSEVADPAAEQVGTGPFRLDAYSPEDRAVLVANENYWREGEDGEPLPYVDGIEFIFSPDLGGQVEALRGGELDFVGGLTSELADTVEAAEDLKLVTVTSNMHYVIHMRADMEPASDNKVRQALKLGTDHQAIIDAVRPGLAEVGNGFTPVGPSYGDYYLDQPPQRDVEGARRLLEEAGYGDGLEITLTAQQALDIPAIATVWKEQMAEIGVTVNIETVPSDVYYGDGEQSWLEVPFGITEWGTRATPVNYFQLAYIPGGPYNESHWENEQMAELTQQIQTELDRDRRIELYHQAQQLMIDEGPVVVPYFEAGVAGATQSLMGVELATDWARTLFRNAYLAQ
ncbi:MAG: ABC transporter substrate-binding protein [Thermoleophilia bacterium]